MPELYNLRNLRKKKGSSNAKCYLHNFPKSVYSEAFNPKVRLERLKLECHDYENSRFILEKGRIIIIPKKSYVSNKKYVLKIFCIITLLVMTSLVMTSLCWKDYFQRYSTSLVTRYSEIFPTIQKYYLNSIYSHKKVFTQCNYKQQKLNHREKKLLFDTANKRFASVNENFAVQQLVKDYFVDIKDNEVQNKSKLSEFFIEEQCKHNLKDDSDSVMDSFYNATFFEQTNLIDYALESQGAKIVTVFNTELYGPFVVNFLNFDLWPVLTHFLMNHFKFFSLNGPNSVLIPWKKPGDCWAFKGSQGKILIELSEEIIITAVTIDHLPKKIASNGSFHSAPKKFSVLGVQGSGNQIQSTYLGSYEYKSAGPPTQIFFIQPVVDTAFKKVKVIFESNQGNKNYTCVYKIRIHGHK